MTSSEPRTAERSLGLSTCLVLGLFFGLVTGGIEVVHQLLLQGHAVVVLPAPDMLWMAPVAHAILFVALGAALGTLAHLTGRLVGLPVAVFGFVFLMVYSQTLHHPKLHMLGVLVVATGIAFQTARVAARDHDRVMRIARRSSGGLGAAVVVAAVLIGVSAHSNGSVTQASLPPTPASSPNVLLIVLDTTRADHLQLAGYHRQTTPNIDRLSERSVVFDRAYSTSPWTLGAHGTMFTGRYPFELSADWLVNLDDTYPTVAETFRDRGYLTAGFTGNLIYCRADHGVARGFNRYEDIYVEPVTIASSTRIGRHLWKLFTGRGDQVRNDAVTVTDRFLRWLPQAEDRPFFAFLNYFDTHAYYDPPTELEDKFGPRSPHLFEWSMKREWTDEEMQGFVDAYDACLFSMDHQIGRVLDHLDGLGILENTLVIITSDHGEQFGEHGLLDHANSLYHPLLHATLMFSFPGQLPGGVRFEPPVSLRDLPATILDLAGLRPEAPFPGFSLAGSWSNGGDGDPTPRSPVLASVKQGINKSPRVPVYKGDMYSLVEGPLQLIVNGDDSLELYDVTIDPRQENNLVGTERGDAAAARMRAVIEQLVR